MNPRKKPDFDLLEEYSYTAAEKAKEREQQFAAAIKQKNEPLATRQDLASVVLEKAEQNGIKVSSINGGKANKKRRQK